MFSEYVRRLGFDPEPLLVGLNETTFPLANYRLWSLLRQQCPDAFSDYLSERRSVLN